MSSILYYSNYCEPSKKLLQTISKYENTSKGEIHFICIDNRVKDPQGKIYIILQNGQKILMPENVTRVPALLLLNHNYKVIYGDDIYQFFKPSVEQQIKQATQNNLEPICFQDGFNGFGANIISSDNYSFLDQTDDELSVKGNGGMRQMHHYVSLNDTNTDSNYKSDKLKDDELENLLKKKQQEYQELQSSQSQIRF
jgi:hypothetical protein